MHRNAARANPKTTLIVRQVQDHACPSLLVVSPSSAVGTSTLFQEGISNVCVDVLLLKCASVAKKDLGVKELEPGCLTETKYLVVDEAIVDAVELVNIIDDLSPFGGDEFLGNRVRLISHGP